MEVDRVINFRGPVHLALAGWLEWYAHCELPRPDGLPPGHPETLCNELMGEGAATGDWHISNPHWNPGPTYLDCCVCQSQYARIKEAIDASAEPSLYFKLHQHEVIRILTDAARRASKILGDLGYVPPESTPERIGFATKLLKNALEKCDPTEVDHEDD